MLLMKKIVLIDDDDLIHLVWKNKARDHEVELFLFFSIEDFCQRHDEFDRKVHIYIDSDLGDGIKGEVESEKIYRLGFENLYLCTGYEPQDIHRPEWIKEIVQKRGPF